MLRFTQVPKVCTLLIVAWCSFSQVLLAQSKETDSTNSRKWYIPTGVMAEYAGGFGMISAGILYHPTKKSEVALTTGYTPPQYGDIWTVNLLASRTFIKFRLNNEFTFDLLNAGIFINANFGDNIYVNWPERYYKNYYWWNSSIRYGPFIESELKFSPSGHTTCYALFIECNTNDLYIASYLKSSNTIGFSNFFVLGTGVKLKF